MAKRLVSIKSATHTFPRHTTIRMFQLRLQPLPILLAMHINHNLPTSHMRNNQNFPSGSPIGCDAPTATDLDTRLNDAEMR